jgi:ferredoxin-nitrate reductase
MFKGGAIRISKLPSTDGEVQIHAREQQSTAVATAAQKHTKPQGAQTVRERGLETWLGELDCAIDRLTELFKELLPKTDRDPDAQNGLSIMLRIATRVGERIKPIAKKYGADRNVGQKRAHALADLLFKHEGGVDASYEMLETMQALHMYLAYIRGSLRGMYPASQALWDKECVEAVTEATRDVAKMEEWCLQQMQFRSPQTLLVPLPLKEGGRK